MQENNLNQRTDFVVELLVELKDVSNKLKDASKDIEKDSGKYFEGLYQENYNELKKFMDNYKDNMEKIKHYKGEITAEINGWYSFTKDPKEIRKLIFPLKFKMRQNKLKKKIKKMNDAILAITVENRFIKEQLIVWEHKIELESIQRIKQGKDFTSYERLIKQKDELVNELKYLLPTIPSLCPAQLDLDKIDSFIETLKKAHAA